jgi:hypothetical protein
MQISALVHPQQIHLWYSRMPDYMIIIKTEQWKLKFVSQVVKNNSYQQGVKISTRHNSCSTHF